MPRKKNYSWVVAFRRNSIASEVEYKETYGNTAQEAVDVAKYIWKVYQVVGVFKEIKGGWS